MKYSGGGGQSSRQEVEQWERKLGDAQNAVERTKLRHQRMTKVFIDVRAGIEHMADKLETVKLDVPAVPISDETIAAGSSAALLVELKQALEVEKIADLLLSA